MRRSRLAPLAFFSSLFIVYLSTATFDARQSIDPMAALVPAWQLAHHGNLTLNAIPGSLPWFVHAGGRLVSNRFPGTVFAAVPFYWLLDHSQSAPSYFPAAVAAAGIATAAMAVLYVVLRHLVPARLATGCTAVVALATPMWSVSADALWTHGPAQLTLAVAMLAAAKRRWLLAGLALGAAVLVRPHLGLVAVVVGLWQARSMRSWRPAIGVAAGTAVGLLLLLYYNRLAFGSWSISGGYPGNLTSPRGVGARHFVENIAGALVSPERGILVLSPFILMLVPSVRAAWREAPAWAQGFTLGGVAYTLSQLWLNRFSGGDNFYGYRLLLELTTCVTPLMVLSYKLSIQRSTTRRRWLVLTIAVSAAVQAIGAISYHPDFLRHNPWTTLQPLSTVAQHPLQGVAVVVLTTCVMAAIAGVSRRVQRVHAGVGRAEACSA